MVSSDPKIIEVALDGLSNILSVGEADFVSGQRETNDYANEVEEAGGCDSLLQLQTHQNEKIYDKAMKIVEKYFSPDESEMDELDPSMNPTFSFPAMQNTQQMSYQF